MRGFLLTRLGRYPDVFIIRNTRGSEEVWRPWRCGQSFPSDRPTSFIFIGLAWNWKAGLDDLKKVINWTSSHRRRFTKGGIKMEEIFMKRQDKWSYIFQSKNIALILLWTLNLCLFHTWKWSSFHWISQLSYRFPYWLRCNIQYIDNTVWYLNHPPCKSISIYLPL